VMVGVFQIELLIVIEESGPLINYLYEN
jgi:hypothetical protein